MKNNVIKEFNEWILTQNIDIKEYNKTCACYIRVSTDKQDEYSPISQLKIIWEYCQRNNLYLDTKYIFIEDEGISGKSANKREEFQSMIGYAKCDEKLFDCILVWKFSRFARNLEESVMYKNLLRKKHNIDVISVSEPIPDGPFGDLIERIIEWSDEYYLTNLSVEVKRGMTEKAEKGGLQSTPPFGYIAKDNILIEKEEEAQFVKMMFNLYAYDNYSLIDIARKMYEMGVSTKRGKKFENRTIYYILRNPVYIGKIRWTPTGKTKWNFNNPDTIIKDGKHTPLIDIETWNIVQKKLDNNSVFFKPHIIKNKTPYFWIRGLIRCSKCGSTLIKFGSKQIRCNGYNKGRCTCHSSLIVEEVENLIISQLKDDFTNKININLSTKNKKQKTTNQKEILEKQLTNFDKIEQRIKEAYMNGIDTLEEYKNNKKELEEKKNKIIESLKNIPNENNEEPTRINKALENGKYLYEVLIDDSVSIEKKWEIAHFVIEKVVFDDDTNSLTLFYN